MKSASIGLLKSHWILREKNVEKPDVMPSWTSSLEGNQSIFRLVLLESVNTVWPMKKNMEMPKTLKTRKWQLLTNIDRLLNMVCDLRKRK